jgi:siroheme synthase (precorrin-2 oxidase/ferrochelatase)
MISDVLSSAVDDLDFYLKEPVYKDTYAGKMRERIKAVRNEMNAIRILLDKFPTKKRVAQSKKRSIKKATKKSRVRKT